jgi:predicted Zn-dependent protease
VAGLGGFGVMLAQLKYSRDDEHQADALGAETLAAAGYDPNELAAFFHRMDPDSNLSLGNRINGIQRSHPVTADREKVLGQQIARMSYRVTQPAGAAAFQRCRTRLLAWAAPPAGGEMTLTNALASLGTAADSGQ